MATRTINARSKQVPIRFPHALHAAVKASADHDGISLAGWVLVACAAALAKEREASAIAGAYAESDPPPEAERTGEIGAEQLPMQTPLAAQPVRWSSLKPDQRPRNTRKV
jgi:hypothetical protein